MSPGRSPKTAENESIRVNVGVTKECVAKIDEVMESSHLFNSRSEFILAALRNLCCRYAQVADAVLTKARDKHGDSPAALDEFIRSMNAMGQGLDERFREQFGKSLNVQIAIRMNPGFYDRVMLDTLSPRGIQPLARMAIVDYCRYIESQMEAVNGFSERIKGMLPGAPSVEDDGEDLLARWDEWASRD